MFRSWNKSAGACLVYPARRVLLLTVAGTSFFSASLFAQGAGRKQVLEGNRKYAEGKYDEANDSYRDAEIDNPESAIVKFNIGDVLYQKRNYEEALKTYQEAIQKSDDLKLQAQGYYNIGNTLYRLNKWPESILAYQQALKLDPNDEDAKYNLEYVRTKLKENAQKQPQEQQNQQQQQQQQQQNQKQDSQQKQDEQNQQEQQQQEQQSGEQQQQEQSQQEKDQQEQQAQEQQGQAQEQKLTKEEAERLLQALEKQEKDAQKQRQVKARGRVRVEKDW
ncbi:tetratricopeptide repeat protein [candidate division KSB1 bacterium]|nr:MAG: tetratricopeptide repeat protein [candidate division KSB1 bacterium]MBC6946733.1 tetratricopeptide repeat protein [candidate division KSB1 bacterium]MCE7940368.1 tetratricopeptide repeat protein [Chlorobi bacterium CHB1]MDL1875632.1 tetratricopeptide repeat protein [Cytophagia bacterium CHB2]